MLTKAPRGTKDILPKEAYKWQYIENEARKICEEFGFKEVRTPTFEHTELVQRGVGETTDIVQKEMYTFLDRGGRSITLKPEGTAPAVRAFIEHNLYSEIQPSKLFYLSPIFRYERPQAGRLREHHQFGIEVFGGDNAAVDVEVISLAMTFIQRMGIENLKVNINSIGCSECRKNYDNALREYFNKNLNKLCTTCQDRFERNPLRILDCKNPDCNEIAKDAPVVIDYLCDDCSMHFEELKKELSALDIPFEVDSHIVRGLDYYTRTVFEIISENIGAKSTVCGGGRYNKLIKECGGPDTPAVGFGLGIERLIILLESSGIEIPKPRGPMLFIASIGERAKINGAKIILNLRKKGISSERDLLNRSLKAQMKYANNVNAKYVVVLGDNEIDSNQVKLKDMESGEEKEILLSNIEEEIKSRI